MTIKQATILCLLTAIVSAAVTEHFFQQTKTVEVEKDVVHNNIKTVIHTVKLANGEVDSTTTIEDHTKKVETDNKTSVVALSPNWLISASLSADSISALGSPIYGVQVNRRILGPIFIGGSFTTKHELGVSLGMEF